MRCNPSRWLWGLLPVAIWSWVTVLGEHARIESDLKLRASDALRGTGLTWATPEFSGRDGMLTGRALDDVDPARAADIASKVWGVRIIDNRVDLIEKVDVYLWSAAYDGSKVTLAGHVPNEEARKAVLGAAGSSFPKLALTDDMKLARGAPARAVWIGGIDYGLKQLKSLKRGRVELSGTSLSVAGEATDSAAYRTVKKALQTLPSGITLVSDKVTPPRVDPFVWSARLSGSQIALTGYVPSEKLRADLFAQVKKSFPKHAIVDRMDIAEGAPEGWASPVIAGLAGLAMLQEGSVEISGRNVTFVGTAVEEAQAVAARAAYRKDVPRVYRLSDDIKFQKDSLPVISPFQTMLDVRPSAVEITGSVASEGARAALLGVIRSRFPGRAVHDRMRLAGGAHDGWQSCLAAAVSAVARLGGGQIRLSDQKLEVVGQTPDDVLATALTNEVRSAVNRVCDADVKIAVLSEPEPNLSWRAVRSAEGQVILSGDVPDAATRAALAQSAARLFPGARIVDNMRVANARSRVWGQVAELGLRSLARLRKGEALLNRQELVVRGEAADGAAVSAVREQLNRDIARAYSGREVIEVRSDATIWAEAEAKRKAEAERVATEAEAKRRAEASAKRTAEAQRCQALLKSAAAEGMILFERASADLDRRSLPTLDRLARIVNACPGFQVSIEGHTDAEGTDERNDRLSNRRAQSVVDYLVKANVDAGRLSAKGHGSRQPIAPNDTAENRAKNRRIEFMVKAE